jgi:transcription initiation factor IIE alpha subunit
MTKIVCPECGGKLKYWREDILELSQAIKENGDLENVKKSHPYGETDMQGFACTECGWLLNPVYDSDEKYPHLKKWYEDHKKDLKV